MGIFLFIMGMLVGASLLMLYSVHTLTKTRKKLMDRLKTIASEVGDKGPLADKGLRESVIARLREASQIAEQQLQLRAAAEMPSKNSMHSRYKNGLVREIQDLEVQKIQILKTVLGDGYNPYITITREGGVQEEVPLAEYVANAEAVLGELAGQPPAGPTSSGPKKAGKFVVYSGGKGDSGGETTH